jgi:hypothetical protein
MCSGRNRIWCDKLTVSLNELNLEQIGACTPKNAMTAFTIQGKKKPKMAFAMQEAKSNDGFRRIRRKKAMTAFAVQEKNKAKMAFAMQIEKCNDGFRRTRRKKSNDGFRRTGRE